MLASSAKAFIAKEQLQTHADGGFLQEGAGVAPLPPPPPPRSDFTLP